MKIKDERNTDSLTLFNSIEVGSCFNIIHRKSIYIKTNCVYDDFNVFNLSENFNSVIDPNEIVELLKDVTLVIKG